MIKIKKNFSVQMIAEAGVMIALAKVLSTITFFHLPQGGSVTLGSMVPLFIFSIRWGLLPGILVCSLYGIVDSLIGGYVIHPIQFLLDYLIAYGALGLAGISLGKKNNDFVSHIPTLLLGIFLRFVCHVLSGVIFFKEYAEGSGHTPFIYSVLYNGSFLLVEAIISLVILALLWQALKKIIKKSE